MTQALTKERAQSKAQAKINEFARDELELQILDNQTIEESWGWVFFYTSEHGEAVAGNAPIIVNRHTGELRETGSAYSIQRYVQDYEAELQGATECVQRCSECGSGFRQVFSYMSELCPECAHYLYGYPNCIHEWSSLRCARCGWNGAESAYIRKLKNEPNS